MTNNTIKLLQANIKKLRKEKGYTQAKFSVLTGISKDYITAIECGRCVPSVKRLVIIADILGIPVKDLFDFK